MAFESCTLHRHDLMDNDNSVMEAVRTLGG